MHSACMPSKTISLSIEAWNRLRAARRRPTESFSQVILRATWPDAALTAGEALEMLAQRPPLFSVQELDEMEAALAADQPPADKWARD